MIPDLDRFREHFRGLESSYLLIGGGAAFRPRRTTPNGYISREMINNRWI
jgi:hypothetical protein